MLENKAQIVQREPVVGGEVEGDVVACGDV
ncbi:MAG: hypothetical protein JWP18_883 [Solirubrobacterales bacterium]|jgi:hypothetical protein|nr:hypothetical protein [Solirubrobacterales bacterium]